MPIKVSWDNECKTIVRYCFVGDWTWDEFFDAKQEAMCLIDGVPNKVGVIMDALNIPLLPGNWLIHIRKALRTKHPRTEAIVVIAQKPVIRTMIRSMRGKALMGVVPVELADDLDEARCIIAARLEIFTSAQKAV